MNEFKENKIENINNEGNNEENPFQRIDDLGMEKVEDLAQEENAFWDKMKEGGVNGELRNKLGDIYSDRVLEKMETENDKIKAEKEKIEAEKSVFIDKLTGLKNQPAFEDEAPRIYSLEERKKSNCSLIMIDIDDFKIINDHHGHDAGDDILKQLAQVLNKSIRQSDFSYRLHGEEFVVLATAGAGAKEAKEIAEKIRENIENKKFKITDNNGQEQEISLTVSVGIAGTDSDYLDKGKTGNSAEEIKAMLKAADAALYQSKNNGKNQSTIFEKAE